MRKQKNGNSIMDDQLSNRINSMYANQTLEKVRKLCHATCEASPVSLRAHTLVNPWRRLW